jgi:hypothetical protein
MTPTLEVWQSNETRNEWVKLHDILPLHRVLQIVTRNPSTQSEGRSFAEQARGMYRIDFSVVLVSCY